MISVSDS